MAKVTVEIGVRKRWFFPLVEWPLAIATGFGLISFEHAANLLLRALVIEVR